MTMARHSVCHLKNLTAAIKQRGHIQRNLASQCSMIIRQGETIDIQGIHGLVPIKCIHTGKIPEIQSVQNTTLNLHKNEWTHLPTSSQSKHLPTLILGANMAQFFPEKQIQPTKEIVRTNR